MAKPIEIKTDSQKKTLKRRIRKWNFKGIISIYIKTILHIEYKKISNETYVVYGRMFSIIEYCQLSTNGASRPPFDAQISSASKKETALLSSTYQ